MHPDSHVQLLLIAPIDGESRFISVVRSQYSISYSYVHLPWWRHGLVDVRQSTDTAARCPTTGAGRATNRRLASTVVKQRIARFHRETGQAGVPQEPRRRNPHRSLRRNRLGPAASGGAGALKRTPARWVRGADNRIFGDTQGWT
ncbi:hypothetical protein [Burkholderia sp. JP2-270]|uniref:hypothetical protein n=1 Tax=Burkholderia sp. JP2-270 TaxID=2217913 RepID=UPI0013A6D1E5|nr:hypothetical protein [Burkholderia sp. JP2-270]